MTIQEHKTMVSEFRRRILEQYPIGSEWYSPGEDDIVVVVAHFEPRGVVALQKGPSRPDEASYELFGYGGLIDGSLIVPREGGHYHEYAAMRRSQDAELAKIMENLPKGSVWK